MSMTDTVADTLTRIRNANTGRHPHVDIPASRLKEDVLKALIREGFLDGYERVEAEPVDLLRAKLRYVGKQTRVIQGLKRVSKPGKRVYVGVDGLPVVRNGLGIAILSTPKGVLTDNECKEKNVGGEVLCHVW